MKSLLLLFLIAVSAPVKPEKIAAKQDKVIADTLLTALRKQTATLNRYEFNHRKNILFLVKLTGKTKLKRVREGDWPDDTEYIYSILKDTTGRIILIEQSPYSQSGDWYVEWKHYFDENGNTFAFSRRESVFDDSVKGGMAIEEFLKYYDANFRIINQSFRLTDKDDKTIKRNKNEFNFRNDKYTIYKNVNDCLLAYHVKAENI
ncbi:MAG TPA: hypothetical protein VHS53_04395 [Mucilaginibacter sp.]|jgi:hypothetical protein|nr:hypothetical protein [Mucilaginibacter sp.]